jgi:RNA polymerase-binding transcription factor DksA
LAAKKKAEAERKAAKKKADAERAAAAKKREAERKAAAKTREAERKEAAKKKAAEKAQREKERIALAEKKAAEKKAAAEAAAAKKIADKLAAEAKAAEEAAAKKSVMPERIPIKRPEPPKPFVIVKGEAQDGIVSTKEFDLKFLFAQREALLAEKAKLQGQATRLEDEANALIEDAEMGDVQFDDEGGEGDTMVVERERDLTLSAQARQTVQEIEAALLRMKEGVYGYSSVSGQPIPRERLKALPWATELVAERAGGL